MCSCIFCYTVRVRFGFVKFSNLRVRVRFGSVRKSRVRVRFGFGLEPNPGSKYEYECTGTSLTYSACMTSRTQWWTWMAYRSRSRVARVARSTLMVSDSLRASASQSMATATAPATGTSLSNPAADTSTRLGLEQPSNEARTSSTLLQSAAHSPNPNDFMIHGGIYHSASRLKQLLDEKQLLPNAFAKYPISRIRINDHCQCPAIYAEYVSA